MGSFMISAEDETKQKSFRVFRATENHLPG